MQIGLVVQRLSPSDNGHFKLDNVPVGTQTINISAIGYSPYTNQVVVRKNETTTIDTPIGLASQTGL